MQCHPHINAEIVKGNKKLERLVEYLDRWYLLEHLRGGNYRMAACPVCSQRDFRRKSRRYTMASFFSSEVESADIVQAVDLSLEQFCLPGIISDLRESILIGQCSKCQSVVWLPVESKVHNYDLTFFMRISDDSPKPISDAVALA